MKKLQISVIFVMLAFFMAFAASPISGTLARKIDDGSSVIVDFIFTNNGTKTIKAFDCVLKFYVQEEMIYEIKLGGVKNHSGAPTATDESFFFRASLPVTNQGLVNASIEQINLVVDVTKTY